MKKVILSALLLGLNQLVFPFWGFFGHQLINRQAVFSVPAPLFQFYKQHIFYLEKHSTDPDKRRYILLEEGARHFIDIDNYLWEDVEKLKVPYSEIIKSIPEDSLQKHGILPWNLERTYYLLKNAFEKKDIKQILKYSADLGHYLGDACVPLHTTKNYNGQFTDQRGIHGFWESRLPELFSEDFDFFVGLGEYIPNKRSEIWKIIMESHSFVDEVLMKEKKLSEANDGRDQYGIDYSKKVLKMNYSEQYSSRYHDKLNGMVEARMQRAILAVASFWYSAWVDAGQPELAEFKTMENELFPDSLLHGKKMLGREE